jgi:hypothetical protein
MRRADRDRPTVERGRPGTAAHRGVPSRRLPGHLASCSCPRGRDSRDNSLGLRGAVLRLPIVASPIAPITLLSVPEPGAKMTLSRTPESSVLAQLSMRTRRRLRTLKRARRVPIKAGIFSTPMAGALIVLGTAPAGAALPGAGAFTGGEFPPNSTLYPIIGPTPLCALFDPTLGPGASPLIETLDFTGTFNGANLVPPFGTATFTSTNAPYDASPLGTFAPNTNCNAATVGYQVPGTMTVNATVLPLLGGQTTYTCTGPGFYSRVASAVVIQFSATATPACAPALITPPLVMTFTGTEVPCIPGPCPAPAPPNTFALLAGTYVQT